MNLQVTFDPNNITSVDAALDLIERLHPTVLTDRARSKERRAAEQAALDEIANSGPHSRACGMALHRGLKWGQ